MNQKIRLCDGVVVSVFAFDAGDPGTRPGGIPEMSAI